MLPAAGLTENVNSRLKVLVVDDDCQMKHVTHEHAGIAGCVCSR